MEEAHNPEDSANKSVSSADKIKEDVLSEHRLMRVLPRSQHELREQEENLASLTIKKVLHEIFNDIDKLQLSAEQKSKVQELGQKYN